MTKLRGALYVAIIAVLLILGYKWRHKHDAAIDTKVTSQVLPKEDKAKYIIDQKRHRITEIKVADNGHGTTERTSYLPDKASVEILKDGTVKVTSRSWGTEVSPFVGLGVGSDIRVKASLGINGFYFQRWEAGGGLSVNLSQPKDVRAFLHVSYNVYSNCILSIGVDNHKAVQALVGLKF